MPVESPFYFLFLKYESVGVCCSISPQEQAVPPDVRRFCDDVAYAMSHYRRLLTVGELRWQPPQPIDDWKGKLDATKAGLPCVQPATLSEFYARAYSETSEDCLTLNVWSRATASSDKLPVMVWIHGGALVMGSGSDYDGAALTLKGVVVVTINYRLGPFGFFAHPGLSSESIDGVSGNQGFRDQIAALEWVRNRRLPAVAPRDELAALHPRWVG